VVLKNICFALVNFPPVVSVSQYLWVFELICSSTPRSRPSGIRSTASSEHFNFHLVYIWYRRLLCVSGSGFAFAFAFVTEAVIWFLVSGFQWLADSAGIVHSSHGELAWLGSRKLGK